MSLQIGISCTRSAPKACNGGTANRGREGVSVSWLGGIRGPRGGRNDTHLRSHRRQDRRQGGHVTGDRAGKPRAQAPKGHRLHRPGRAEPETQTRGQRREGRRGE
jgi:hypothetical protein